MHVWVSGCTLSMCCQHANPVQKSCGYAYARLCWIHWKRVRQRSTMDTTAVMIMLLLFFNHSWAVIYAMCVCHGLCMPKLATCNCIEPSFSLCLSVCILPWGVLCVFVDAGGVRVQKFCVCVWLQTGQNPVASPQVLLVCLQCVCHARA